mgnify:CR=1 FL=1
MFVDALRTPSQTAKVSVAIRKRFPVKAYRHLLSVRF